MRLLREKLIREIREVFLPYEVKIQEDTLFKFTRVGIVDKVVEDNMKTYGREVISYQFERPLKDNPKKTEWIEIDKEDYERIIYLSRGWQPEYIGRFKIKEKIIGITF